VTRLPPAEVVEDIGRQLQRPARPQQVTLRRQRLGCAGLSFYCQIEHGERPGGVAGCLERRGKRKQVGC
jgi:hypothetical protein